MNVKAVVDRFEGDKAVMRILEILKFDFHLRPFVYDVRQQLDLKTFERTYAEDRSKRYPLRLFVPAAVRSIHNQGGSHECSAKKKYDYCGFRFYAAVCRGRACPG